MAGYAVNLERASRLPWDPEGSDQVGRWIWGGVNQHSISLLLLAQPKGTALKARAQRKEHGCQRRGGQKVSKKVVSRSCWLHSRSPAAQAHYRSLSGKGLVKRANLAMRNSHPSATRTPSADTTGNLTEGHPEL